MSQKNEFTIGEMAKLHNLDPRTLRYYDSLGLFSPTKIGKNGYRYYRVEQFETLSSIRFLRHMGLSIKEISQHLKKRDLASFREKLKEYRELKKREMERLEEIGRSLDERIDELSTLPLENELGKIFLITQPSRSILYLKKEIYGDHELELSLRELETASGLKDSLIIGRVGMTVSYENLEKGIYDRYNSIYLLHEGSTGPFSSHLEEGEYATVYVGRGDHEESKKYYRMINNFISEIGYKICGDALERVIVDPFISSRKEDYLMRIEVPVTPHT